MSPRFERNVKAFLSYLPTFLVGLAILAAFEELIVMPSIAWHKGYPGYLWPPMSRVYAACKFVPLASFLCAVIAWVFERKRIGW
jgi:hypothetical protein